MARQRIRKEDFIEPGKRPGLFEALVDRKKLPEYEKRVAERAAQDKLDNQAMRAEAMEQLLPTGLQGNQARAFADRVVDVQDFLNAPNVRRNALIGAGVLGAGAVAGAGLKAYSDQSNEYLPRDPMAVAGRMVTNTFGSAQPVGMDPLAEARNSVARAAEIVGTEEMLGALAKDQMMQMESEKEALTNAIGMEEVSRITRDMIDNRALELMQTPIQYSDGSVRPMRYDEALRHATEQVHMEMRANNVY